MDSISSANFFFSKNEWVGFIRGEVHYYIAVRKLLMATTTRPATRATGQCFLPKFSKTCLAVMCKKLQAFFPRPKISTGCGPDQHYDCSFLLRAVSGTDNNSKQTFHIYKDLIRLHGWAELSTNTSREMFSWRTFHKRKKQERRKVAIRSSSTEGTQSMPIFINKIISNVFTNPGMCNIFH